MRRLQKEKCKSSFFKTTVNDLRELSTSSVPFFTLKTGSPNTRSETEENRKRVVVHHPSTPKKNIPKLQTINAISAVSPP
jgi:hypothetical protein